MDFFNEYKKMITLRGLTSHTVKSYCTYISAYLQHLKSLNKCPSQVSWEDMRIFIDTLQKERNLADRTINTAISQLRFFTMYVLHKPWDKTQLPIRKFNSYLPHVPSQEDVKTFIHTIPDLKQKAMVALMYSSGLRIGEVCNLKYQDVQRKNMRIHICHSKNRSDRYAQLSMEALEILTEYWLTHEKPTGYLFPKQTDKSRPIDTFYLSRHIHAHEERLKWPRKLTCHSFRHAYGTHLYENGTDLMTIKVLLGHKTLESTTIYVHLAIGKTTKAVSPFDQMGGINCEEQ